MTSADLRVGVVIIGRNEGARLLDCFASLGDLVSQTIYVDSGSTDGSQAAANSLGVQVIDLDQALPFTAARARNAGFKALLEGCPNLEYVQFIDGDCTLHPQWIRAAHANLDQHPNIALVCGRRREKFPDRSIYNAMCDHEWDGPTGSILECGGDFLVRAACFSAVDGFFPSLIAGEEPELCLRLREHGWQIWRLPREMTLHDANIMHFGQWWQRAVRAGHAYAEVSWIHAHSPQRIWHRNVLRALGWAAIAPIALLGTLVSPFALTLLLAYPADVARQAVRRGVSVSTNWRNAFFMTTSKLPEAQGILKYHLLRILGGRSKLIEYK